MVLWVHVGMYYIIVSKILMICSYVLTGTDKGFEETFGSTCHGAVSIYYTLLLTTH